MANGIDNDASLTEKAPIPVSAGIGLALSQTLNVVQQFCHCFTADQLSGLNTLMGTLIAVGVGMWQSKNIWSKASVAKVLDAHSPQLTTAEAKTIANEGVVANK